MKSGLLIVALAVFLSGCTGSNRGNRVAVFSEGASPAPLRAQSVTDDSPGTNSSRNAESQDVIKQGDTLLITFTNLTSGLTVPAFDQRVRDDGTITLIYNNVFHAAGKKTGDLEREIRDFFVPANSTNLTVRVRISAETRFVYVDGEFRKQGRYSWTNGMTLKDAIEAAGGFTDFANRRVRLVHTDGTVERYRLRGDWTVTNNPVLKPGDKVHNPRETF
jgi:protein involved in polysaccharide export with SLBB domain